MSNQAIEKEILKLADTMVRGTNPSGAYAGGTCYNDLLEQNGDHPEYSRIHYRRLAKVIYEAGYQLPSTANRELDPPPRFDDVYYQGLKNMNEGEQADNREAMAKRVVEFLHYLQSVWESQYVTTFEDEGEDGETREYCSLDIEVDEYNEIREKLIRWQSEIPSLISPPMEVLSPEEIVFEMNCSKGIVDTYDENIIQVCKDISQATVNKAQLAKDKGEK